MTPAEIAAGGKPTVRQRSGSISTEKTITIEADGKHYVIPSIINGKSYTPEAAAQMFMQRLVEPVGAFNTAEEARLFAEQRSRDLDAAFGGGGVLHKGPSDPANSSLLTAPGGSSMANLFMRFLGNGGPNREESMPNPVHSGNGSVVMSGTGTPVTSRFGRGSAPIEERQMDRAPIESRTLTDRPMPLAQMMTQQMVPHDDLRLNDIVVNRGGTDVLPWWPVPPRMQADVLPWNPLMYYDMKEPDVREKFWGGVRR